MDTIGTIEINKMRVHAFLGVSAQERTIGNTFEITVRILYPITRAMNTDNLSATIDYAEMAELIKEVMQTPSLLLENLVNRIKTAITKRYPNITGGLIKVAKLNPPISAEMHSVAVSIKW